MEMHPFPQALGTESRIADCGGSVVYRVGPSRTGPCQWRNVRFETNSDRTAHGREAPIPEVSKRSKQQPYSMIWSASASSLSDTVRPSPFAVLKLITTGTWSAAEPADRRAW